MGRRHRPAGGTHTRSCSGVPTVQHPSLSQWLEKWAALTLEFVELERLLLPAVLVQLPEAMGVWTPRNAQLTAEVRGPHGGGGVLQRARRGWRHMGGPLRSLPLRSL